MHIYWLNTHLLNLSMGYLVSKYGLLSSLLTTTRQTPRIPLQPHKQILKNHSNCKATQDKQWTSDCLIPSELNCLCRASRACSLPRSSFMVLSMWLALRELPLSSDWNKHTSWHYNTAHFTLMSIIKLIFKFSASFIKGNFRRLLHLNI